MINYWSFKCSKVRTLILPTAPERSAAPAALRRFRGGSDTNHNNTCGEQLAERGVFSFAGLNNAVLVYRLWGCGLCLCNAEAEDLEVFVRVRF